MSENINLGNIAAEREVIGTVVLENNLLRKLNLSTGDFYSRKHRDIYKAMLDLDTDGRPIDLVTLSEKLIPDNISYLSQVTSGMITTANLLYHADIIKECANKRSFKDILQNLLNNLDEPLDDLLIDLRNNITELIKGRGGELISMSSITKELELFLERRSKNQDLLSGIRSGFRDLDILTDGFQRGDLAIIAGRPGSGKSALAMAVAQNAGVPVGVISIEMGAHQIGIRTLASFSGIELWRLRKGILSYEHWGDLNSSLSKMAALPIYFSFSSKNTTEIQRTITGMVESYKCELIIIDYLQLTKGTDFKSREREVAEISRLLKVEAQSNNIPIIAVSQLNREVERRENKRPILSDLRESGAIEQDADIVIFLYREKMHSDEIVEVIIAKGRNIGLGTVKLHFSGDTMTFRDLKEDEIKEGNG